MVQAESVLNRLTVKDHISLHVYVYCLLLGTTVALYCMHIFFVHFNNTV